MGETTATRSENLALIEQLYKCVFRGDFVGAQAFLSEDFVLREAEGLPYGGELIGPEALGSGFRLMLSHFRDLKVEKVAVAADGDYVMGLLTMSGIAKATDEPFAMPVVEVFRFSEGRVSEIFPVYWDTRRIAEITGHLNRGQ